MGKKLSYKVRKKRFLYSHECRHQNMAGNKRSKQFFQKHTNSASKKCWEKISSKKSAKKHFLYTHEYRDQKMRGQNERNNFSRNTRLVPAKNFGKNIVL